MSVYFSSRDTVYRTPFGAVAEGVAVHFRILLPRWWGCSEALLCTACEGRPDRRDGMFWAGQPDDDHEWWECHFSPAVGVYRYYFELVCRDGKRFLTALPDGTAAESRTVGSRWQLTCYDREFKTPDWLAGGVFYQIFPDRFYASGTPKENVPADRVQRADWGGQPVWEPNAAGKVLNNDFFGGDLKGIVQKLPYLKELGVTCLYLNPIFESHSNHRYDTADYERIDPQLGTADDLRVLTEQAEKMGIRVILDGVFSHTGSDSRYFNKQGRYGGEGAYQSVSSPYYPWYQFRRWPNEYASWWGFDTLPEIDEMSPAFREFITGENGVCRRWMRAGAKGWRLDVADELPDPFIDALRTAVKAEDPDGLLLGEVWEDASNKESYGHLRRYLLGRQLDSVMNYPFADAILRLLTGGRADDFFNTVEGIVENYPPQVTRLLMNHIGTHDTERALTVLAGEPAGGRGRRWQAGQVLTPAQRERGLKLMRLASLLQFCLPGVPCVYYGDEAGMEGYRDPFNRGCYPWGNEEQDLLSWYRALGEMRKKAAPLKEGSFKAIRTQGDIVCFTRKDRNGTLLCAVNKGDAITGISLPDAFADAAPILGDGTIQNGNLILPPLSGGVFLWGKGRN